MNVAAIGGGWPQTASRIRFRCSSCNKLHEGLPDLHFEAPEAVLQMSADERDSRALLTSDFCILDGEQFFIRGILRVPVQGVDDNIGWGAWCRVYWRPFKTCYQAASRPGEVPIAPFGAWLATRLPGYEDSLDLPCSLRFSPEAGRSQIELRPSDHDLFHDQIAGIPLERAIAFAHQCGAKVVVG